MVLTPSRPRPSLSLSLSLRLSLTLRRSRSTAALWRALLVIAVGAGIAAAPARAATCPGRDRPVEVHLDTRFDTAQVDHTRSRSQINRLFREKNGQATIPMDGAAVGLTTTQSQFRFNARTQTYPRGDGMYCVYLRRVDAWMTQANTTVYIAREYPKGSCQYRVTYEHEKMHVGVYYYTQKEFAPRVGAALKRLVQGVNPRVVRSADEAQSIHAEAINQGITPILDALARERARRNAALDTPENYARERAKCPRW